MNVAWLLVCELMKVAVREVLGGNKEQEKSVLSTSLFISIIKGCIIALSLL